MVYEKQTWLNNPPSATTPISAERLSHLETQYDEAIASLQPTVTEVNTLSDTVNTGRLSETELTDTFALKGAIRVRERRGSETNDGPAFNEALAEAYSLGGATVTFRSGRAISLPGGHLRRRGVSVDFGGNTVSHTGNNVMLKCSDLGGIEFAAGRGFVRGAYITGNAGTNAVAFELGNTWGFVLKDITIAGGYSNGIGIDMHNRVNWCEGTIFDNVMITNAKTGVRMIAELDTIPGQGAPRDSFAYSNLDGLSINVPENGVGIDMAGTLDAPVNVYHSRIGANMWLKNDGVAINMGERVRCWKNLWELRTEASPNTENPNHYTVFYTGGTGTYVSGVGSVATHVPEQATLHEGTGWVHILSPASAEHSLDTRNGVREGNLVTNALVPSPSFKDEHTPRYGFEVGDNVERAVSYGYAGGGADVFRVYSSVFGGGGTPEAWSKLLGVSPRKITLGDTTDYDSVLVLSATSNPGSTYVANPGSLYSTRTGGLFFKVSGTGGPGWQPVAYIQTANSGSFQNIASPVNTVGKTIGMCVYDTTTQQPFWATSSAASAPWKNADGTVTYTPV